MEMGCSDYCRLGSEHGLVCEQSSSSNLWRQYHRGESRAHHKNADLRESRNKQKQMVDDGHNSCLWKNNPDQGESCHSQPRSDKFLV